MVCIVFYSYTRVFSLILVNAGLSSKAPVIKKNNKLKFDKDSDLIIVILHISPLTFLLKQQTNQLLNILCLICKAFCLYTYTGYAKEQVFILLVIKFLAKITDGMLKT